MAPNGHIGNGNAGSFSSGMYHNSLHAWRIQLADMLVKFMPEENAFNVQNKNDLQNVLRPIEAYSEVYWIQFPERKTHPHVQGY